MKAVRDDKTGTTAALMIFCVFAMFVLTVLMLGVSAYRNMTDISREGHDERAALSYIWTKVKYGDAAGMVYETEFGGAPAIAFDELYDGVKYHTMVYHHEGRIYDIFFEDGLDFSPEDGTPVLVNESLSFEPLEAGLIKVSAGSESVFILPRGRIGIALSRGGP